MQENVRKQIRKAKERKKRMRRLCAIILCLSILVAGTVSWQLVLPGVAMSGETYCGKEEHTHSEACYGKNFICGKEEGAGAHTHTEDCYTEVRTDELICGQEESSGHTHTEECYTAPQELTCGQEEYPEHTHTEECCATIQELTCGQEESPEHAHTDDCYTEVRTDELICGQEESPGHTHTEECCTAPQELTCGQEEHPEHTHTEECYATTRELTCDQEESEGHVHTDECCETGTELTCGQEEHTHSAQCYSNPDAVETEDEWKAAFAEYQLTGEWGMDIAAIAKSQVGYAENTENYSVSEDGFQKGYTRYADWAGDDLYGDWDAYFAAFVLNYAGVPTEQFPVNAEDPEQWITDMQNSGYYTTDADAKMEAGDLVVLEKTDQDRAQQFGIVSEVETDEDGNADTIKVVEGNVDSEVKENTYSVSGGEIVGYGLVSAAYEAYTGTKEQSGDEKLEQDQTLSEQPPIFKDSPDPNSVSTLNGGETLDKRLEVIVTGKMGENGQTLDANIVVTHSDPKDEHPPVVKVNISDLPEGVTLEGFDENDELTVKTSSVSGATEEQVVTVKLHRENGKPAYISFLPPAGSTMNFFLQFNSKNGIMAQESKVTLIPEIEEPADNDSDSGPAGVVWTGKNEWNPVDKTVNRNRIPIQGNSLQGVLDYTIKADSLNGDGVGDTGDIWTQEVLITDTLTLPDGITFPADAKVQQDGDKASIVTSNGETLFSFTDLQGGKVTNLELSDDKKTVTYQVTVPNSHMQDGVPTKEQDNLSLSLRLDASKLVLEDDYIQKGQTAISQDEIKNHVYFESIPYKEYTHCTSEDAVVTTPYIEDTFEFTKTSEQEAVSAGDTIRYTISIKNTGSQTILGSDGEQPYYVSDKLPDYLELTKDQIEALEKAGATYDPFSHTIQWKPGDIKADETKTLVFEVTVKSAADVGNISAIQNTASYKDKQASDTIQYKKPEIELTKESDVEGEVGNGDKITYTIVIENKGDTPVTGEEIMDQLPSGLEMLYVLDKDSEQIKPGTGSFQAASSTTSGGHTVNWTYSGQTHTWELGTLAAKEIVTIKYVCQVNTDEITGTTLKNGVTTTTGETDSDEVPVKKPIKVEKQVKEKDEADFGDGGGTYEDGTELTYQISITNDEQNPNMGTDHRLVDQLPTGVLLSDDYKIYKKNSSAPVDIKDLTPNDLIPDTTITSWKELTSKSWAEICYTIIGEDIVEVKLDWGDGTQLKQTLTWFIGEIKPGATVTKQYNAQISLSDNQNTSSADLELTNKASVGNESDSVTIKGKVYCLLIKKYISGDWSYNSLTDEQKANIKFSITRVDESGETLYADDGKTPQYQEEISLKEFAVSWDGIGSYTIGGLEKGYYKIEETSTGGYDGTVSVTMDGQEVAYRIVEVSADTPKVEVEIRNVYGGDRLAADVQKSVWSITDQTGEWDVQQLKSKYLFRKSETGENYVVYNITVMNTGKDPLQLDTLVDEMDPNLQYIGMRDDLYGNLVVSTFLNESIHTDQWAIGNTTSISGEYFVGGVPIKADVSDDKHSVTFHVGEEGKGYSLEPGMNLSFFVMCKAAKDADVNKPLTNTVDLIVDGSVSYKEYDGSLTMKGTAADENQNNGDSIDEGVTDGKRTISSSVSVMPAEVIIPGITKTAAAYIRPGHTSETPIKSHDNIWPNSIVRWTVELRNDGTIPIVGYTIEDSVESPFHILSQKEYENSSALKDINVFALEIYNEKEQIVESVNLSDQIWEQVTDEKTSNFTVKVTDKKLAIPPGGKARFCVYTNNTKIAYNIYENTATFTPEQDFSGNDVIHGQLVTDENGKVTGVQASDSVYALGDYGSFSWKTVEEEGNPSNIGYGYQGQEGKNYITVDEDTETVIYTNNIENLSAYDFTGLSMIDLMPIPGDTGVLNQSRGRESEFTISFLESLELYICDGGAESSEKTVLDATKYSIEFSSKVSFTDEDFNGAESEEWHPVWQKGDKSFRIVFDKSVVLERNHVLTMEYKGHIEADANPGEIAWNSFGYQYTAGPDGGLQTLKAEPPKVGVKIPEKAIIKKVVLDSSGVEAAYDEEIVFTFDLYKGDDTLGEKVTSFTLCQGEGKSLNEIKKADGTPAFENGQTYTIKEVPTSGYESVSIGQEGETPTQGDTYTFTYYRNTNSINIVVTNRVIAYKLPETGGIGTTGYFTGGAALMLASSLLSGYRMRRKRERRGR